MNKLVARAFNTVVRKDFVPQDMEALAQENTPLPIGFGQTISQPYTVKFMLNLLSPSEGEHIVDVGHGSGWQTALLAFCVGEKGKVYAIELVKELCEFGKCNVEKYPELSKRVEFFCQNASSGLPEIAQNIGGFNGIIAAAEVLEVPSAWREQLRVGGRLVYPKGNSLFREFKKEENKFGIKEYPGFVFVPFIS